MKMAVGGDYDAAINYLIPLKEEAPDGDVVLIESMIKIAEKAKKYDGPFPEDSVGALDVCLPAGTESLWVLFTPGSKFVPPKLMRAILHQENGGVVFAYRNARAIYSVSSMDEGTQRSRAFVDRLSKLVQQNGIKKVNFLATSRWGLYAPYLAKQAKADGLALLSPITTIDDPDLGMGAKETSHNLVERMRAMLPEEIRDASKHLGGEYPRQTQVIFCEGRRRESYHAMRLSGIDNVHLHAHPTWTRHDTVPLFFAGDYIDRLLGRIPADAPSAEEEPVEQMA